MGVFHITLLLVGPESQGKTPMDMVAQMMLKVNTVFNDEYLDKLARETGFIKRKRKIQARAFLENLMFLRLEHPHSSLEDLVYEFHKNDTQLTKQALHKKLNSSAVAFVHKVLEKLLDRTFTEQHFLTAIPFINEVQLIDSSEIKLNKRLNAIFPQTRNQGAALKVQSMINLVNNQVISLDVRPSKEPDQAYKDHLAYIQRGDLLISDLGYFCVESFNKIDDKGGFFLSRYFKNTNIYLCDNTDKFDLRTRLSKTKETQLELPIFLGTFKFPCRLVAIKLPEDAYQKRLANLKEKHRKDPRSKDNPSDLLNQWTIFVTNLPHSVNPETLLNLYGARWQIELFFKMMKTFLNLRKIHDTNQSRASISLYISLIAVTLLSSVAMTMKGKEISLHKAASVFVKNVRVFFDIIHNAQCAISWMQNLLSKFALKESRSNRPSTKKLLEFSYA